MSISQLAILPRAVKMKGGWTLLLMKTVAPRTITKNKRRTVMKNKINHKSTYSRCKQKADGRDN
jgi:hypothetical protein